MGEKGTFIVRVHGTDEQHVENIGSLLYRAVELMQSHLEKAGQPFDFQFLSEHIGEWELVGVDGIAEPEETTVDPE